MGIVTDKRFLIGVAAGIVVSMYVLPRVRGAASARVAVAD